MVDGLCVVVDNLSVEFDGAFVVVEMFSSEVDGTDGILSDEVGRLAADVVT